VELLGPFLAEGRVKKVRVALKRHLDTFDDLRDTQVQLVAVGKMLAAFPAAGPFHDYLQKRETRFTRQTRKHIKRIETNRLGKLITACREDVAVWRMTAAPAEANVLLLSFVNRAFGRTKELKRQIRPSDTESIHRTRVAFKKFRYMVETLADQVLQVSAKALTAMHRYQTMMGEIQDAEVFLRIFAKFLPKGKLKLAPARRLHQELRRRRQRSIRIYLAAADQLSAFWPEAGKLPGARPDDPIGGEGSTRSPLLRPPGAASFRTRRKGR
jgi:CHAD domain-containing protein